MAIQLSSTVEQRLRRLAESRGQQFDVIVEKAILHYLDALAITDINAQDVGQAQMRLADELGDLADERFPDEAA